MNSIIVETLIESAIFCLTPSFYVSLSTQSHTLTMSSSSWRRCLNTDLMVSLKALSGTWGREPYSLETKQAFNYDTNRRSTSTRLKNFIKSTSLSYNSLSVLAIFLMNFAIAPASLVWVTSRTPTCESSMFGVCTEILSRFEAASAGLLFLIKPNWLLKSCSCSRFFS